jgi:hypothetical protein
MGGAYWAWRYTGSVPEESIISEEGWLVEWRL